MRRAAKVDANQSEIVHKLRQIDGVVVQSLASLGEGVPDLLVSYKGRNVLIEVKNSALPPSAQKLTEDQQAWHLKWTGQVDVVRELREALVVMGVVTL